MKQDLITVITSAYNAVHTISRAIDSVLNQTYKNIEYIIVDHGSDDNTCKILEIYKKRDNRVKILKIEKNMGYIGKAMNYGLEHAKGKYVCFLDADDSYSPEFLEKMYCEIIKTNADIAICGYRMISEKNNEQLGEDGAYEYTILDTKESYKCLYNKIENDSKIRILIDVWWNKLYSLEYLKRYKIKFPENTFLHGDAWFNREIFDLYSKIVILPYIGYKWYQNANSTSKSYRFGMYREILNYVELWINSIYKTFDQNVEFKMIYNLVLGCSNQILKILNLEGSTSEKLKELENWITYKAFYKVMNLIQCQTEFLRNIELSIRMIEEKETNLTIEKPSNWLEEYISLDLNKEMDKSEKFEKMFSILFEEDNYTSVGTQGLIDMIVQ